MERHPHFAWRLLSGNTKDEALLVELHPRARPECVVTIRVKPPGEMYFLSFGGVEAGPDFAYQDDEQREVFKGLIQDAVAVATGPSRLTRQTVGGIEVRSCIVIEAEGPNERSLGETYRNFFPGLKARLRGQRRIKEIVEIPSITGK